MQYYLLSLAVYYFAMNLSGIFISIYLWKAGHRIIDVAWYNMYYSLAVPLMCIAAGWIIKRGSAVASYRLGIGIEIFFYMMLLYFRTDSINYIWILGCLKGTSTAFWAMGMHTMTYDFSKSDEYPVIFSFTSIFTNISALLAPLITGFVLMLIKSQAGYNVIFSCSLLLYIVSVTFTAQIQSVKVPATYNILRIAKSRERPRTLLNVSYSLTSAKSIIFSFLINLLLYIQTGSEFSVGLFSSAAGIACIFILYVVGRRVNRSNRLKVLCISAFAVMISVTGLIFKISISTILIYILLSSMFEPLAGIVQSVMFFEMIKNEPDDQNLRTEYIISREFPIAAGRIGGLLIFILFRNILSNPLLLKAVILVLGSVYIWSWIILRKVDLVYNTPKTN